MTATTSTTEPTTESPADERFVEHPLAPGRIAIHDPAIVEDNGTYYVFGTHRRCARSTDLVHWERFENNLLYLVVFRFGLPECLEIRKRWYFNAFAILQVVTGYDCMKRNVTVFVCGLYAE